MQSFKKDFGTKITGWTFIVAAALLWLGYMLLGHHLGEYIQPEDFAKIGENVWFWIWMYRVHIFGWVIMSMALLSLITITARSPYHVLVVPGAGMTIVGSMTLALGTAFYYGFGADGVGATAGLSPEEMQEYMKGIRSMNYYATCLFRFGRIFSGLGLVVLGAAFIKWKMVDSWLAWFTVILGLAAMSIILFVPVNFEVYKPIFHIKAVWLLAMGILMLRKGVSAPKINTES